MKPEYVLMTVGVVCLMIGFVLGLGFKNIEDKVDNINGRNLNPQK